MAWKPPPEFVEASRFKKYGISWGSLHTAINIGLLKLSEHYVAGADGTYYYHRDKIRALVPEIRDLRNRQKLLNRKLANQRGRRIAIIVDSELKRKIARQINDLVLRERELEGEIEQTIRSRRQLEFQFSEVYWERAHCPYCNGLGTLGDTECSFCKEHA